VKKEQVGKVHLMNFLVVPMEYPIPLIIMTTVVLLPK
jgi:hypothetical protein